LDISEQLEAIQFGELSPEEIRSLKLLREQMLRIIAEQVEPEQSELVLDADRMWNETMRAEFVAEAKNLLRPDNVKLRELFREFPDKDDFLCRMHPDLYTGVARFLFDRLSEEV
jgi:hypothetical protein